MKTETKTKKSQDLQRFFQRFLDESDSFSGIISKKAVKEIKRKLEIIDARQSSGFVRQLKNDGIIINDRIIEKDDNFNLGKIKVNGDLNYAGRDIRCNNAGRDIYYAGRDINITINISLVKQEV